MKNNRIQSWPEEISAFFQRSGLNAKKYKILFCIKEREKAPRKMDEKH